MMYNIVLTLFLAVVFCAALSLIYLSVVIFIQDRRFFSSAPKEIQAVIKPRTEELFNGARAMGWVLLMIGLVMASGVVVVSIWDGMRNDFTFSQFFIRLLIIMTVYKLCDMILVDNYLLLKAGFFQHFYPETEQVMKNRRYGFNIRSQLLKLLVIFPGVAAITAWICTRF